MPYLNKLRMNWEGFAQVDPLWAICADPERQGQWTQAEFFATGRTEIERVMQYLSVVGLSPTRTGPALDFGCGVGRLTRALADYFPECWGVDIAPTMIQQAKAFNRDRRGCYFCLNERDDLRRFPDAMFEFAYTSIVLHHMPAQYAGRYLVEMIRTLKTDGILVFQVVDRLRSSWWHQVTHQSIRTLRRWVTRLLGRKNTTAYHMAVHCFPEQEIRELLSTQPAQIVDVQLTNAGMASYNGNLQFLEQEPQQGYVSKQYCVVKAG